MAVQINGDTGNVSATKADFSGNISIGGTLTYEDVTNVDSVGLITARTGIEVGARPGVAASISVDGNAIFSGITTIGGQLNLANNFQFTAANPELEFNNGGPRFRVPTSNQLSIFTTGGLGATSNERIRLSSGRVGINTIAPQYIVDLRTDDDPSSGVIQLIRNNTENGNGTFHVTDLANVGNFSFGMPDNTDAFILSDGIGNSGSERLRINADGNVNIGSAVNAGDALRYFDVCNFNTGSSAGAIVRLLTTKSDGSGTGGLDIVKYKSGTAGFLNYENVGTVGDITFSTSPAGGSPLECLRLFHNGYIKFNRMPLFISNTTSTLGADQSLTASPASGKAQFTAAHDVNSNWDNTNKNFVCPVNGYYNVAVNFSMGDMALSRRIVVMGYTLGGANGAQSNYLEALDMTMDDHTNQNYSQPWYFTAGTTVAVGMGGLSGDISSQTVQLSVFLITAV